MRIAQCIKPLRINLLGNRSSVAISEGWQGDLDQVIGVNDDGVTVTVQDALGHHYTPENFRLTATGDRRTVAESASERRAAAVDVTDTVILKPKQE